MILVINKIDLGWVDLVSYLLEIINIVLIVVVVNLGIEVLENVIIE